MPRIATGLDPQQKANLGQWLNDAREARGISLNTLARFLGWSSGKSGYIRTYLTGATMPTPATLICLARAIGLSPTEALLRAAYVAELFDAFARLEKLGRIWCEKDGVQLSYGAVRAICGSGSRGVSSTADLAEYLADQGGAGYALRRYVDVEFNDAFTRKSWLLVFPRPFAAAIGLAVSALPSRFFVRSTGALENVFALVHDIDVMLEEAASISREQKERIRLPALLDRAAKALSDKQIPREAREAVASEYVGAWCDTVASEYAEYARQLQWSAIPSGVPSYEDSLQLKPRRLFAEGALSAPPETT